MTFPATMDTADIARLLGVSRPYVTDFVTKQIDFPAPHINVSRRMRRWLESDIQAWMRKKSAPVEAPRKSRATALSA